MSKSIVFNHHSLMFQSVDQADSAIPEFLKIALKAQKIKRNVILVDDSVDAKWFRIELSKGYFWQDWYNKNKKEAHSKELIRAFRSIATRQPLFSVDDIVQGSDLVEVYLPNSKESLSALKAAIWHESPLLSFPTCLPWNQSPVKSIAETLDENANIVISQTDICNLYSVQIFKAFESHEIEQLTESIRSGKELIENQKTLFPLLCFCGKSKEQLTSWANSLSVLEQVKESLFLLNTFSNELQNGKISEYSHETLRKLGLNHKVSGESPNVKQNPKLRKAREFWLPTGKKEFFENHIKLSKGYRIHFFTDIDGHFVFIGYIGSHLPLK